MLSPLFCQYSQASNFSAPCEQSRHPRTCMALHPAWRLSSRVCSLAVSALLQPEAAAGLRKCHCAAFDPPGAPHLTQEGAKSRDSPSHTGRSQVQGLPISCRKEPSPCHGLSAHWPFMIVSHPGSAHTVHLTNPPVQRSHLANHFAPFQSSSKN